MNIRITGKRSVYLEIAEEYKRFIRLGVLSDGDKLPSVRALAVELGINPNTVERAYTLLESEGYIRTIVKKGAYVDYRPESRVAVLQEARKRVEELRDSGLTRDELYQLMDEVYGRGRNDRDQGTD